MKAVDRLTAEIQRRLRALASVGLKADWLEVHQHSLAHRTAVCQPQVFVDQQRAFFVVNVLEGDGVFCTSSEELHFRVNQSAMTIEQTFCINGSADTFTAADEDCFQVLTGCEVLIESVSNGLVGSFDVSECTSQVTDDFSCCSR